MNTIMISLEPDVLARLLTLRLCESESLNEVLLRVLPAAAMSTERATAPTPSANGGSVPYQLDGETHVASDATEAMISILADLAQYDNDFFPKLAAKVRGRTRNHIARSRSEVYPGRSDLTRYVKEIGSGWFIGCNVANREKKKILRMRGDGNSIWSGSEDRSATRLIGVPIAARDVKWPRPGPSSVPS